MTPVQLPEVPAPRDCVAFRWEGDPINEASDPPWKYASHWSTPPWDHRPVECLYTAAQLREYATEAVMAERARLSDQLGSVIRESVFKNFDRVSSSQYVLITGPSTIALSVLSEVSALLTPSETNSG